MKVMNFPLDCSMNAVLLFLFVSCCQFSVLSKILPQSWGYFSSAIVCFITISKLIMYLCGFLSLMASMLCAIPLFLCQNISYVIRHITLSNPAISHLFCIVHLVWKQIGNLIASFCLVEFKELLFHFCYSNSCNLFCKRLLQH